jgi:hypothetical protein
MPRPDIARFAHKKQNWELAAEHFNATRLRRDIHVATYDVMPLGESVRDEVTGKMTIINVFVWLAFLTIKPTYGLLGYGVGKNPDDAWADCEASVDPKYLSPLPVSEHKIKCGGQAVVGEGE